jgi:tRNA (guanine37-N1)-methyltransferase
MRIDVITLFPEFLRSIAGLGVIGRALADGQVELQAWNPRDYAQDRHRSVDDRPYGGGPGMVMTIEPTRSAIRAARSADQRPVSTSLMSPQGRVLDQAALGTLAARERLLLVCGRYEGIDERLIELEVDEELSIGDYVISGGELAAAVVIDAVTRLLPGVLGDEQSAEQDSFMNGLLDHPHYSRPEEYEGLSVPPVLLSGDHAAIARWRRRQALGRTWLRRPELLQSVGLAEEDKLLLEEFRQEVETKRNESGTDRE